MDGQQTASDQAASNGETATEQQTANEAKVVGSIAPAPADATPQADGDQTASELETTLETAAEGGPLPDDGAGGSFASSIAQLPTFAQTADVAAAAKAADDAERAGMTLAEALQKAAIVTQYTKGNPRFIRALYAVAMAEVKSEVEFLLAKLTFLETVDAAFETAGVETATPAQVEEEWGNLVAEERAKVQAARDAFKQSVMEQIGKGQRAAGAEGATPLIVQ